MTASDALRRAAKAALAAGVIGVHEAGPVQGAFPRIEVEPGSESEWGHKGDGSGGPFAGVGREVRLVLTVRAKGEASERLHAIMGEVELVVGGIGAVEGWQVVSLRPVRSRAARESGGWAGMVEFRARMLRLG